MASSVNNMAYQKKWWLIKAPLGLSIIGFGVCLVLEAGFLKYGGASTWTWVPAGTGALIVFNAGICVLGDAVKHRGHYERLQAEQKG